ncbi:TetR/AcrR family transcriptional regulator [Saccharomonospora cyanea]|uniref:Transcriptional regulator n=1 Tax=Saccharomonospora cyanea NA-134 TaxID=882082 RepID=H5XHY1_9PSEU|nr:TetR/AcrR family transcriptional regulator [Saccharomonospora cyanea]EHR59587.1 transcriptional regulator [Saccharomonospora cyanea NA-134]
MPRPKSYDDSLRAKLLDRAGALLSAEGSQGLSLRKLASEVGTSTTAVYSLFGGKPELIAELRAEGFRAIGDRLRSVTRTGDAVADLVRLGMVYREAALAGRHSYPALFTGNHSGDVPVDRDGAAPFVVEPLRDAAQAGIDADVFPGGTADTIAAGVWAYAHGMVMFELHRTLSSGFEYCRTYEQGLRATVRGWCR